MPKTKWLAAATAAILLALPGVAACDRTTGDQPEWEQEVEDCDDWEDGCGYVIPKTKAPTVKTPIKVTKAPQPRPTRRRT